MQARTQLLAYLLDYTQPLAQTIAGLRQFPWDSDSGLIILKREHIIHLLERYLSGELTGRDIEAWANAIEGREDIDYAAGQEDVLQESIYMLANPILTEPLNTTSAQRLLKKLL